MYWLDNLMLVFIRNEVLRDVARECCIRGEEINESQETDSGDYERI
jgi:hypothetical protein